MRIEEVWPEWHECVLLGEGSFGKVYKAEREALGTKFYSAIKVLSVPKSSQDIEQERKQGLSDNEIHQYFASVVQDLVNEIVLMESLKGARNIVGIDDYQIIERTDEIGWDIFIRMELLTPFEDVMKMPEFSYIDVLRMGIDICSALEMCEYNGIVHRDIKPDNIFVSKYGEYKLGDFGISRQLDKTQANMSRKGTLNFMAPEVYKGEPYGSSVDTYSLGLVLYKLLNGNRLPFISSNAENLSFTERQEAFERRIRGETLPYIGEISQGLNYILQKACSYTPANRYISATEMKNDLIAEAQGIFGYGYSEITVNQVSGSGTNMSFNSTTNDMTGNGAFLMGSDGAQIQQNDQESRFNIPTNTDGSSSVYIIELAKTSKVCRFMAIPTAIAMLVASFASHGSVDSSGFLIGIIIAMLAGPLTKNKIVMGLSLISYVLCMVHELLKVKTYDSIVLIIIAFGALLLLLLSGITMLAQKEVRFSGMLNLYGGILFVIPDVIEHINVGVWLIKLFLCISVCLWSYGYDSKNPPKKAVGKIVYFSTFAVLALDLVLLIKEYIG